MPLAASPDGRILTLEHTIKLLRRTLYRQDGSDPLDGPLQHTGTLVGFFAVTPQTRAAAPTSAVTGHTLPDPADAPATADALRDDIVANTIPAVEAALNVLGQRVNELAAILARYGLTR